MLDEHGAILPHAWIAGDDEMGRSTWFRAQLRQRGEQYLLAVPSNTTVRDLAAADPPYTGRGRPAQVSFVRVERWAAQLPASAWQTVTVREGTKGPVLVQVARGLVQARTEGRPVTAAEQLLVVREQQEDGSWKHDYLLAHAALSTPLEEFARVFKAEHRIEESLQRAKSEAGLADYQVRTWMGWHHHQALSLVATWFLTQEARRGKKIHAGVDGAAGALVCGAAVASGFGVRHPGTSLSDHDPSAPTESGGTLLPLEAAQTPNAPMP
jgi:SRSO17 transposase